MKRREQFKQISKSHSNFFLKQSRANDDKNKLFFSKAGSVQLGNLTKFFTHNIFFFLCIIVLEYICEVALSTVLPVEVGRHKNPGTTFRSWAFTSQTTDFAVVINLVVLQSCELDVLMFVLDDLRSVVCLLLPLFPATSQTKYKMKS